MKRALIQIGGNILGSTMDGLLGRWSQQSEFENIQKLRQQENSWNHPAAQRARMEQAGISAFAGGVSSGQASTTTDAPTNKAIESGLGLNQFGDGIMNALSSASQLLNDKSQRDYTAQKISHLQADILLKSALKLATEKGYDKIASEIRKIQREADFVEWQEERSKGLFNLDKALIEQKVSQSILENELLSKDIASVNRWGFRLGSRQDTPINLVRAFLPTDGERDLQQFVNDLYNEMKRKFYKKRGKDGFFSELF